MISREQVAEHRKLVEVYERIPKIHAIEILDTLDAALKVIEEIKKINKGPLIDGEYYSAIHEAVYPFTAPRGKE